MKNYFKKAIFFLTIAFFAFSSFALAQNATGKIEGSFSATNIGPYSAKIIGRISNANPQGLDLRLRLGKEGNLGTESGLLEINSAGNFSVDLSTLIPDTTYQYQIFDESGELTPTDILSFKTLPRPGVIANVEAWKAGADIIHLRGHIGNAEPIKLNLAIEYGVKAKDGTSKFENKTDLLITDNKGDVADFIISGLKANTEYRYRVFDMEGKLAPSTAFGFRTGGESAVMASPFISILGPNSAKVSGQILNDFAQAQYLTFRVEYGVTDFASQSAGFKIDSNGNFSEVMLGTLQADTTYRYRVIDTSGLLDPSNDFTFTTFVAPKAAGTTTSPLATKGEGLVPCTDNCGWDELLILVHNLIQFVVFYLSLPIAAIVFAYSGWLFMTSGDNPTKRAQAISIFKKVGLGLVIAMSAWLIVNTILTTLIDPDKLKLYSLLKG